MSCLADNGSLHTAAGAVSVDVAEGGVSNVALSCDELGVAVSTATRVVVHDIIALARGDKVRTSEVESVVICLRPLQK